MIKSEPQQLEALPKGWKLHKLVDVTELIFSGGTPNTKKPEYWNGEIPWLSSGETNVRFIRDTEKKITKFGVNNSSTRLAKVDDVIVASAGQGHTRGQTSFCLIDTYINQSIIALRSNKKIILPLFLFYNLLSRYSELRQVSDSNSSRGSLTRKHFVNLDILLPTLKEQKKISNILFSIDSKIVLNNQLSNTLEKISYTLFKHWFIDFEFPDDNDKSYKSAGGKMNNNAEFGKIPVNSKIEKLGKLITLIMGMSPKGESYNLQGDGMPLINGAADFSNGNIIPKKFTTKPTRICKNDDLLFCIRGTIGNLTYADKSYCLGRGVASISPNDEIYKEFVYFILNNKLEEMISKAAGSVIIGLSKSDITDLEFVLPPENIIKKFHSITKTLFYKKIKLNMKLIP